MKRKTRKILSLLLALTVMATMLAALPLTASMATLNDYVEWNLAGDKNSTITFYSDEECKQEGTVANDENYIKPTGATAETSASLSIKRSGTTPSISYGNGFTNADKYETLGGTSYNSGSVVG